MTPAHTTPDCTGRWSRENKRRWRCTVCGAVVPSSPAVDREVLEEYHRDVELRALAWEGRRLLERDGEDG